MTPAEKAYQDWVDEGDNRYGTVHKKAFERGYEEGYIAGNQAAVESRVTKFIDAYTRVWVGLMDEEIMEMMDYGKQYGHIPQYARNFVEAITSKLKEKNQ